MTPIIIAGMHRSGTSAVARLVQSLGINIGSNLLEANDGNRHGHFEEIGFLEFHDRLIARCFPDLTPFCEMLPRTDRDFTYTEADRAEARRLWESHRATGGMAWKEPRTSLFLDLWLDVLPDARLIVCLRHPYQVHLSLLRRHDLGLRIDYGAALRGWMIYNRRILRVLGQLPPGRFLVVDVDQAFRLPAVLVSRLAKFLEIEPSAEAAASITPESFHFDGEISGSLEVFFSHFPEMATLHRAILQAESGSAAKDSAETPEPLHLADARLIEFEESCGVREQARALLIRSVSREIQVNRKLADTALRSHEEKDRLIEDLSQLNDLLKRELLRFRPELADGAPGVAEVG